MDENNAKSITTITNGLHKEVDKIFDDLMSEDFKSASKSLSIMAESIKHLKTNLKNYEV